MTVTPTSDILARIGRWVVFGLPAHADPRTAAKALGLSRTTAYRRARTGACPCRLCKEGRVYVVRLADLMRGLGIHDARVRHDDIEAGARSASGSALAYEAKHRVESATVRDSPVCTAAREHTGVDLLTLFDQDPRPDSATRLGERGWHTEVPTPSHFTHRLGRGPCPETHDALAANRWTFATRPKP
ncbi:helix-turn-helix domain-containing protein [Streptomyces sp. NPDC006971]|uniref:helix-turn-helix domain-containing protein n=1 Tax=Streptomyces sp. NPDC006971 TaxID=3154784 RepID=UPI0033FF955F